MAQRRRRAFQRRPVLQCGFHDAVPTGRVIAVEGRISRKIGYDGKFESYSSITYGLSTAPADPCRRLGVCVVSDCAVTLRARSR